MHFLDPTNDYAFKRVFGNENKKEVLMSFLNSLLAKEGEKTITDVTLLDGNQAPHIEGIKRTVLDVRCRDQSGSEYIVEMQVMPKKHFDRRVLYYASRAYGNQLDVGTDYDKLNPVVFIGILGFQFTSNDHFLSNHLILDVETGEHIFQDFNFVLLELPKFSKKGDQLDSVVDQWVYFLKNAKHLETVPEVIREEAIKEAFEIVSIGAWSRDELMDYDRVSIARCDTDMELEYRYDRGMERGREEATEEIARKLYRAGTPKDLISQTTGISLEELGDLVGD